MIAERVSFWTCAKTHTYTIISAEVGGRGLRADGAGMAVGVFLGPGVHECRSLGGSAGRGNEYSFARVAVMWYKG